MTETTAVVINVHSIISQLISYTIAWLRLLDAAAAARCIPRILGLLCNSTSLIGHRLAKMSAEEALSAELSVRMNTRRATPHTVCTIAVLKLHHDSAAHRKKLH
jgi:hypothetical protein